MVVVMEYEIAAEAHLCEFRAWQCLRHIPPPGPQKLSLFPFWKLGRFHFSLSFFQKRKIERNAQDFFFFLGTCFTFTLHTTSKQDEGA